MILRIYRSEKQYYYFSQVKGQIMTVRVTFIYKNDKKTQQIRIIGTSYWINVKKIDEKEN